MSRMPGGEAGGSNNPASLLKFGLAFFILPILILFFINKALVNYYNKNEDLEKKISKGLFLFLADNTIFIGFFTILTVVLYFQGEGISWLQGDVAANVGIFLFCSALVAGIATALALFNSPKKAQATGVFGKQRWANMQDILISKLANPTPALVLGKQNNTLVGAEQGSDWHTILIGGAGTGKTSCGIVPTLLTFQGSIFVLDIKGEIEEFTREHREKIGPCYVINPSKEDTWAYNPITACGSTPQGINECIELGRQLVPYPPGGPSQNQWVYDGARGLVSALAYIVSTTGGNLEDVARYISLLNAEELMALIQSADNTAIMMASSFLQNDEKVQGYFISQASDFLRNFALDYELIRVTNPEGRGEFNFNLLEQPSTVYLQVPEQKLQQSADLFRLIFMQLLRHLQARGERKQPHIAVILDEFPQLGTIPQLPEMLATLRSRNVHIMLAGQSIADIDMKYQKETRRRIIDNCNYISIFGAGDPESQKYFSDMIGQQTVISQSGGTSDNTTKATVIGGSTGQNRNWQETGQPLLRPEELKNLGDKVVVIARQTYPLKLEKAFWKNL